MSAAAVAVRDAAQAFGTDTCMYGAGVGRRCPNPPTHRSPASTCVWCGEHAAESDLPIPLTPEAR